MLSQLDVIIGDKTPEDLKQHEHEMLRHSKPVSYNIYKTGNVELEMTNGFQHFLFTVEKYTTRNLAEMTTMEAYALFDWIEEENKPKK